MSNLNVNPTHDYQLHGTSLSAEDTHPHLMHLNEALKKLNYSEIGQIWNNRYSYFSLEDNELIYDRTQSDVNNFWGDIPGQCNGRSVRFSTIPI